VQPACVLQYSNVVDLPSNGHMVITIIYIYIYTHIYTCPVISFHYISLKCMLHMMYVRRQEPEILGVLAGKLNQFILTQAFPSNVATQHTHISISTHIDTDICTVLCIWNKARLLTCSGWRPFRSSRHAVLCVCVCVCQFWVSMCWRGAV